MSHIEIFHISRSDVDNGMIWESDPATDGKCFSFCDPGWYWWSCVQASLPDGEPSGPFDTEWKVIDDIPGSLLLDDAAQEMLDVRLGEPQ